MQTIGEQAPAAERVPRACRATEGESKRRIRLRCMTGPSKGMYWESSALLRVGRLEAVEIVLQDDSVSRRHAEVRATAHGWRLSDLGSTNGTFLNGIRLGSGQWPLRARDLIQFGDVAVVVEALEIEPAASAVAIEEVRVELTANASWEEALTGLAFDGNCRPRPGDQLLVLLRAGHHLGHHEREEDLLNSILNDAVAVLDAQRGAIVLAEGPDGKLNLRALVTGQESLVMGTRHSDPGRPYFSQSLAQRAFSQGESILCHSATDDSELAMALSVNLGAMSSMLCVLLRTPRRKLGVLHLDRGPLQKAFTHEDLRLADALAANVSAGIESAQLLRKQRDLFLNTIDMVAELVEFRDSYTGDHTERVKNYSIMLGKQLGLSPADMELIRIGTPLHDIGKVGIDDAILRKPGRLTPEEFELMKLHTVRGAERLAKYPDLHPIIPIVRSHHERWDGKGYPDGLAGEAIPRLARIVAVADSFDAMTTDRPYRKAMSTEAAFTEVKNQAGRQFDPDCAAAFLAIRDLISEVVTHVPTPNSHRPTRMVSSHT